jgi:hypothetical protein
VGVTIPPPFGLALFEADQLPLLSNTAWRTRSCRTAKEGGIFFYPATEVWAIALAEQVSSPIRRPPKIFNETFATATIPWEAERKSR